MRMKLERKVKSYIETYTQEAFDAQTKVDEVAGKNMSLALQREYRAAKEYEEANKGAVVNVIAGEDEKERLEVYPPAGKKVMVESLVVDGQSFSKGSIGSYTVDEDGNHKATISYTSTIDIPAAVGKGTEKKTVTITEEVDLTNNPVAINQIRTQFNMKPIKDVPLQDTGKKRKAY